MAKTNTDYFNAVQDMKVSKQALITVQTSKGNNHKTAADAKATEDAALKALEDGLAANVNAATQKSLAVAYGTAVRARKNAEDAYQASINAEDSARADLNAKRNIVISTANDLPTDPS